MKKHGGEELLTDSTGTIRDFLQEVAEAQSSALLLDYDGTLAPLQQERNRAVPYAGIASVLQPLMQEPRTRIAIITGRRAGEVARLLGLTPPPEIWGSYGLEHLHPDGTLETIAVGERTKLGLEEAEQWLIHQQIDRHAERKPGGLAVHWRGLPETTQHEMRCRALLGWFAVVQRRDMDLVEFEGGVEIRAAGFDKGDAVRAIVRELDADAPVAYLGDDGPDEPAFQALDSRGLGILVRPLYRATTARAWLRPPEGVLNFLHQWLEASKNGGARFATASGTQVE
jgi:trehalose 6-phosphate phosphatase